MGVDWMKTMKGKQSIEFDHPPYLLGWSSVVADKEGKGPLGNRFDQVIEDPLFGEETWEMAEGRFMKQAAMLAIQKAGLSISDIRWSKIPRLLMALKIWICRCLVCSGRVPL